MHFPGLVPQMSSKQLATRVLRYRDDKLHLSESLVVHFVFSDVLKDSIRSALRLLGRYTLDARARVRGEDDSREHEFAAVRAWNAYNARLSDVWVGEQVAIVLGGGDLEPA